MTGGDPPGSPGAAVALSMAFGPEAGLAALEAITPDPALSTHHLLPSVRGDLLQRLGRWDEARVELERAASLTRNESERGLLRARAAAARRHHPSPAVPPPDPAR